VKKVVRAFPFLFFILLLDRFFFLPGRMDAVWQHDFGANIGDPIVFSSIEIISNFEIQVKKTNNFTNCYLLGCYFGNLYLIDAQNFTLSKYSEIDLNTIW
jgi:hypothetical protein